jgi:hypothetical protein
MKTSFVIRLLATLCIFATAAKTASACQCGASRYGRSAWDNARQTSQFASVIFEGTPVHFEFKLDLLTAREGELIPGDMYPSRDLSRGPHMVITFRVQRPYKGDLGSEVQLTTGLGGGDCGAIYATGLNYLVYPYGPNPSQLAVSMCSPGGWTEDTGVATNLRYLRKQPPIAADLAPILRWSEKGADKQREQDQRAAEEGHKRYVAATGRICGTLIQPRPDDESRGTVGFLSTQGYSPSAYPDASINQDGSFCSRNLGPGKYYLYFVRSSEHGLVEALYYPGVTDVAKATAVEVTAGQTVSNIVFKAAAQSTYSVRGIVSFDEKPEFHSNVVPNDATVILIRTDGDRRVWYHEKATFFLPRLAYFKFENVVPGRYATCVMTPGPGWMTRKAEVNVITHMKFISLDLLRKK